MAVSVHTSIADIPAAHWNALRGTDNPFLRHEFLSALENSGCVSAATGWRPQHLALRGADHTLMGAVPLYLKNHSFGEFVFDWSWADAYHRAGWRYYPKLSACAPFSPVTGRRLLLHPDADVVRTRVALIRAAVALAGERRISSLHWLFPAADELPCLEAQNCLLREDCQFQWRNRGYGNFDDFLAALTAKRRKETRRERRSIAARDIRFATVTGHDLDTGLLSGIYRLYADTYLQRGRTPYLNQGFFRQLAQTMPAAIRVFLARHETKLIGMAFCLRDDSALYGRYWGAEAYWPNLHFETCYYQGIDYCIRTGLQRFEPGTQGEFKLWRGFEPTPVYSAHWIAHPQGRAAIADFLRRERRAADRYLDTLRDHLPFKTPDHP